MNRRVFQSIALGTALLAHGCGNSPTSQPSNAAIPGVDGGASTPATAEVPGFKFSTGPFEIQQGDTFECFYTDTITEKQMSVQGASGTQGPGGHHLTIYYTDQKVPVGHHHCNDVEMLGLHQIGAAADGNEGVVNLPDGYATKVPAGKQLVVQAHYVRTAPGPITVEDHVVLKTVDDKDVLAYANSFVVVDTNFKLAARNNAISKSECVVPRDLDVMMLLGHMHEWGTHFKLEQVDEAGKAIETVYETSWEPLFMSHPPINHYPPTKPLKLKKGMRLRQTCEWKNTEDHEMTFPHEMCVTFTYYFPDDGFLQCETTGVKQ